MDEASVTFLKSQHEAQCGCSIVAILFVPISTKFTINPKMGKEAERRQSVGGASRVDCDSYYYYCCTFICKFVMALTTLVLHSHAIKAC